jgi:DNA-binding FadR family transcriptional regulator
MHYSASQLHGIQPIEDQDRVTLIENRIRDYIHENRLQPGDKLPTEEQLAAALGVGRTAVRETFRRLEALGIVESRQGVGRVVREFSFDPILKGLYYGLIFRGDNIMQVLEIRRALDDYFIGPAIMNLTAEDMRELEEIVERIRKCADGASFNKEDHDFHAVLYRRCGNPLAAQLFEITWNVRLNAEDRHVVFSEIQPGSIDEHVAILNAIQARDVELARKLLAAHHDSIGDSLLEIVARRAQES